MIISNRSGTTDRDFFLRRNTSNPTENSSRENRSIRFNGDQVFCFISRATLKTIKITTQITGKGISLGTY
jgi:hypothetical protein